MKLPSFHFYPGDWRKDPGIRALSFHDRAVWFEVLCLMHESPMRGYLMLGDAAMSDEVTARVLAIDLVAYRAAKAAIIALGVGSVDGKTGALFSRRMVRDTDAIRAWRKKSSRAGKKSVKSRNHHSAKGLNGKFSTEPNAEPPVRPTSEPPPNSSSSSSSSVQVLKETHPAREAKSDPPPLRIAPILPTLDQAMAFAPSAGIEPKAAECWWFDCDSRGLSPSGRLIDAKGAEIHNWQSAMTSYGRKWQSNDLQRAKRPHGPPANGKPASTEMHYGPAEERL